MGRLALHQCYLIGGMCRSEDGGVGWRKDMREFLEKKGIFVLDPSDKPIDIGLEDFTVRKEIQELKDRGEFSQLKEKYGIIRNVDLHFVDRSSFVICMLDLDESPCGSYEELFLANSLKKICLVYIKQGKKRLPNWLYWTLNDKWIYDDMNELKNYITYIDENPEEPETFGRWKFIDNKILLGNCIRSGFDIQKFIQESS